MKRTTSSKQIQPPTQSQPDMETIIKMISNIVNQTQIQPKIETPTPVNETPTPVNETQPAPKPKKQLTEKQLSALAAGRAKNPRFKPRNV